MVALGIEIIKKGHGWGGYGPHVRETRKETKRVLICGNKVVRHREEEQRGAEEQRMGCLRRDGSNTQERERERKRGGQDSGSSDQTSRKARSGVSQLKS